jgi:hypothetical protein
MNFKQFFYQQELNEGKNITLPPEVLAAIDQHLPEIMSQICESKNTGKKFEMNLVEFNNKYIKKSNVENPEISRLNLIFKWDQMQKDPVIEEIKKQVDQLQTPQTPNQIIKIIIDPEKTETMTHAAGWANTEEIKTDYLELKEKVDEIIDNNYKNITEIFDKYYSEQYGKYMRELQSDLKGHRDEIIYGKNIGIRQIKYYFDEETKIIKILGTVHINEKYMCGKNKEEIKTLLVHEIIHCIDPKLIYNIRADKYYSPYGNKYNYEDLKTYKSNEMEIEANIGEMVQKIFDLVNNSTDYQKTKYQIEIIAQQLRGAPRPNLTNTSRNDNSPFVNWMKDFFDEFKSILRDVKTGIVSGITAPFVDAKAQNYISPLKSDPDFDLYTKQLTPEIKRKVLERLSNAVIQAREILERKYVKKN